KSRKYPLGFSSCCLKTGINTFNFTHSYLVSYCCLCGRKFKWEALRLIECPNAPKNQNKSSLQKDNQPCLSKTTPEEQNHDQHAHFACQNDCFRMQSYFL